MKITKSKIIDEKGQLRNTSVWNIEVDYNNIEDLEELSNKIKSQLGSLKSAKYGSKRDIKKIKFDSCNEIYNTDISDLYSDIRLDTNPNYYVYVHCEPNKIAIGKDGVTTWFATLGVDLRPFYVGKGIGNRAYDLNRNETHRKIKQRLKEFNQDIQVKIIKDGLTELEALCLESKLIDIFGLVGKGGHLVNLDEGIKSKERQERYGKWLSNLNSYYKNSLKV
jgi:hypothetical protein